LKFQKLNLLVRQASNQNISIDKRLPGTTTEQVTGGSIKIGTELGKCRDITVLGLLATSQYEFTWENTGSLNSQDII
jgi:hypothetical protein